MSGSDRSVLVLGGTGFIGRALILYLASAGFSVAALAISGRSQRDRLPKKVEGLDFINAGSAGQSDIANALAGRRFDAVINLAASGVRPDQRTPENLYDGNIALLLNTLSAVAVSPPKLFIQTGSWFEYGPVEKPHRLAESHSLLTHSIYGSAKVAAFVMGAAAAHAMNIPFVSLRLFHVYGPGESSHRLIPYMVDKLLRGERVDLTGGEQIRDFIYLEDVLAAYKAALLSPNIGQNPVYNVCTGIPCTVRQMCETVADTLGITRKLLNFGSVPYRDDETLWSVGDETLIHKVSGWKAETTLQRGVEKTIETLTNAAHNAPHRV